jgi:hypothetical protein
MAEVEALRCRSPTAVLNKVADLEAGSCVGRTGASRPLTVSCARQVAPRNASRVRAFSFLCSVMLLAAERRMVAAEIALRSCAPARRR